MKNMKEAVVNAASVSSDAIVTATSASSDALVTAASVSSEAIVIAASASSEDDPTYMGSNEGWPTSFDVMDSQCEYGMYIWNVNYNLMFKIQ